MKTVLAILALVTALCATQAEAACNTVRCVGQIESLYISPSTLGGVVYIKTDQPDQSNLNCTLVDGTYLTLKKDSFMFDEMFKALLAAKHAGSTVNLRVKTGSSICELSYMVSQ